MLTAIMLQLMAPTVAYVRMQHQTSTHSEDLHWPPLRCQPTYWPHRRQPMCAVWAGDHQLVQKGGSGSGSRESNTNLDDVNKLTAFLFLPHASLAFDPYLGLALLPPHSPAGI